MTTASRTWRYPRLPAGDWTFITIMSWLGALALVPVVGFAIDYWDTIANFFGRDANPIEVSQSGWSIVASIVPWFIAFIGGYYLHEYLPAFVANGRTRRDSATEAGLFGLTIAGLIAVLVTVGFALERWLYALMDWSREEPEDALFSSYDNLAAIFGATLLTATVWTAAGMAIGAAYYRDSGRGIGMVLVALILVVGSGIAGGTSGPFYGLTKRVNLPDEAVVVTLFSLVATFVLLVLGWMNVRDAPIRNK